MAEYVLCKQSPGKASMFVCGLPEVPSIDRDVQYAVRFSTPDEALEHRGQMPHHLGGGVDKYKVFELFPSGQVKQIEP
jgi:hypothetical protein